MLRAGQMALTKAMLSAIPVHSLLRSGTVATQPHCTVATGLIWLVATMVMRRSRDG
jgi:hypothetical protein